MATYNSQYGQQRWLPCRNNAGEEIPFMGLVVVEDVDDDGTFVLGKPDGSLQGISLFGVNGHRDLPDEAYGEFTMDWPTWVRYDDADTPSNGQIWGPPFSAGFEIVLGGYGGMIILGGEQVSNNISVVMVHTRIQRLHLAKTESSHSAGAGGTIGLFSGATQGSESDTNENLTAWNRFADLETTKWVVAAEMGEDHTDLDLISGEC